MFADADADAVGACPTEEELLFGVLAAVAAAEGACPTDAALPGGFAAAGAACPTEPLPFGV